MGRVKASFLNSLLEKSLFCFRDCDSSSTCTQLSLVRSFYKFLVVGLFGLFFEHMLVTPLHGEGM